MAVFSTSFLWNTEFVFSQLAPVAPDPNEPNATGVSEEIKEGCAAQFDIRKGECDNNPDYPGNTVEERFAACRKSIIEQCYTIQKEAEAIKAQRREESLRRSTTPTKAQQAIANKVKGLNKIGLSNISDFFAKGVRVIMGILGTVSLCMFMYGGVVRMFARGNATQIEKSTKILVWSALGVTMILASYTIVDFFFQAFA